MGVALMLAMFDAPNVKRVPVRDLDISSQAEDFETPHRLARRVAAAKFEDQQGGRPRVAANIRPALASRCGNAGVRRRRAPT